AVADHQVIADLHAALDELIDFLKHGGGIDDHSAGDDGLYAGIEDAAWDQREFIGLPSGDDSVSGVGAPLITNDDIVLVGDQVYELPLGPVAPLQADHTGSGHAAP